MNYIHDPSKFPQKEHFAAIVFETVRESGYDRDDTGSTRNVCQYIEFKDKEELIKWVTEQEAPKFGNPRKNYKVFSSRPLPVTVTVNVNV